MYKNQFLSDLGLSITQNAIGSTIGGIGMYQLGTKYIKTDGWKLAGLVVLGVLVGSRIESVITLPRFKN